MRRALLAASLLVAACRPDAPAPVPLPADARGRPAVAAAGTNALAATLPAAGTALHGSVVVLVEGGRIHVAAAMDGAAPGGRYTIAIHERGDCTRPGPVFALPGAAELSAADPSGAPDLSNAIGDLGGFTADAVGQVRFTNSRRSPVGAGVFTGRSVVMRTDAGVAAACGVLQPLVR